MKVQPRTARTAERASAGSPDTSEIFVALGILHELASDGIHAKSDEECVDIFDKCRKTFDYVFGKIRIETEEARKFVVSLSGLGETRTKTVEAKDRPQEIARGLLSSTPGNGAGGSPVRRSTPY